MKASDGPSSMANILLRLCDIRCGGVVMHVFFFAHDVHLTATRPMPQCGIRIGRLVTPLDGIPLSSACVVHEIVCLPAMWPSPWCSCFHVFGRFRKMSRFCQGGCHGISRVVTGAGSYRIYAPGARRVPLTAPRSVFLGHRDLPPAESTPATASLRMRWHCDAR